MSKHVVIEAHLVADNSIHNPHNVADRAAQKVKEMLEENYKKKELLKDKDGKVQEQPVKVLLVTHRISDILDTPE